jgi:hypothetical protein
VVSIDRPVHRKKKFGEFPVPSRDVSTKLSLCGNNDVITELFLPRGSLVSDIPAGDGKLVHLFLRKPLKMPKLHHTKTAISAVAEVAINTHAHITLKTHWGGSMTIAC